MCSIQTISNASAFEAASIDEKNRIVSELNLVGTYFTALGGPHDTAKRPILQIISAQYKKFSEITDTELVAESLFERKLSALELKILLHRIYALCYNKWLTDDDVVFCIAHVKVGDM